MKLCENPCGRPSGVEPAGSGASGSTLRGASAQSSAETTRLLQRVVSFYSKTLYKDRAGLAYLKTRRLDDPTMLEVFQVGYVQRLLGHRSLRTTQLYTRTNIAEIKTTHSQAHPRS